MNFCKSYFLENCYNKSKALILLTFSLFYQLLRIVTISGMPLDIFPCPFFGMLLSMQLFQTEIFVKSGTIQDFQVSVIFSCSAIKFLKTVLNSLIIQRVFKIYFQNYFKALHRLILKSLFYCSLFMSIQYLNRLKSCLNGLYFVLINWFKYLIKMAVVL